MSLSEPRHLTQACISKLHATAVSAGLEKRRALLLGGIHNGFASGLPVMETPSDQLLSDLNCLNAVVQLEDKSVPLRQWLQNAHHITATDGRREQYDFNKALNCLNGGRGSCASKEILCIGHIQISVKQPIIVPASVGGGSHQESPRPPAMPKQPNPAPAKSRETYIIIVIALSMVFIAWLGIEIWRDAH